MVAQQLPQPERLLRRYASRFETRTNKDLVYAFTEPERQLEALWIFNQQRPHHKPEKRDRNDGSDPNAPFAALTYRVC